MTPPHSPLTPYGPSSPDDALDLAARQCHEVTTGLWDYLDGNCSSELADRIEAHLLSCVPCLGLRRSQERYLEAVAGLTAHWSAPRRLRDRVRLALEAERRPTLLS